MTAPTITALPSAPDRGTPGTTFSATAATFVAALPDLVTELNAFGTWLNSNTLTSYSWGNGTAAAPSIHPASDTNTGWWFPAADTMAASTGGAERLRITSTGVGVGTASPGTRLDVKASSAFASAITAQDDGSATSWASISLTNSNSGSALIYQDQAGNTHLRNNFAGGDLKILSEGTERVRVKAGGNVGIGAAGPTEKLMVAGNIAPTVDNTHSIGTAPLRWSVVYAGTGTINTSDERTKTDIQDLNAAEQAVAVAAKALLKKYRFKDAKERKGDKARWHFGVVAQELAAAFEAEGLDPWAYGLLCHDFWVEADVTIPAEFKQVVATPAELDEEGNEVTPAVYEEVEETPERVEHQTFATLADVPEGAANVVEHDRMGVRYDELFAFILAAI